MILIRILIYKASAHFPPLSKTLRWFYQYNFFLFQWFHKKKAIAIFPRRGFARNEIVPGLSDIDVLYVFANNSNIKDHLARVKRYRFFYPLAIDVEYMDEDLFNIWLNVSDIRSLEFRANIKKNYPCEKTPPEEIGSEIVLFISSIKECFNIYQYLVVSLQEDNAHLKEYLIKKHVSNIYQVIYFFREKNFKHLSSKRGTFFKRELGPRGTSLQSLIQSLFQELDLFSKEFLDFVETRYHFVVSRDNFPYINSDIFFKNKIVSREDWAPPRQGSIPLSSNMFLAIRMCSIEEHAGIQQLAKITRNPELINYYFQRIYSDIMMGGIVFSHLNTRNFLYLILQEILKLKDLKEIFEQELCLSFERELNTDSPLDADLGIQALNCFIKHWPELKLAFN